MDDPAPRKEVVFTLPPGNRPAVTSDFEVPCEIGRTVVTITPEGDVLADPNVGWIKLDGISFPAA